MDNEIKELRERLENVLREYALPFDVSHYAHRLLDEIQTWEEEED